MLPLIPERTNFGRSARSKIFRIKRKNNVLVSYELIQFIGVAMLIARNKIRCWSPHIGRFRNASLNQSSDVGPMGLHVYFAVDSPNITGFIDDEGHSFHSVRSRRRTAVQLANGKVLVSEQRKSKVFLLLKLPMCCFIVCTDAKNKCFSCLNLAQLITE